MRSTVAVIAVGAMLAVAPAAAGDTIAKSFSSEVDAASRQQSAFDRSGNSSGDLRAAVPLTPLAQAKAQGERRPPRVRIQRENRPLGPNAVRQCEAWYEQEFRPSGTVIVPRMSCFWRRG